MAVVATLSKGYDLDYIWKQVDRGPAKDAASYYIQASESGGEPPAQRGRPRRPQAHAGEPGGVPAASRSPDSELLHAARPQHWPGAHVGVFMIESQVQHVLSCLRILAKSGRTPIEVTESALRQYNDALERRLRRAVCSEGGCDSWYLDADGINRALWPGFSFETGRAPGGPAARLPGERARLTGWASGQEYTAVRRLPAAPHSGIAPWRR